ncbi:hypothetical protein KQX54_021084 [Cotesia glomerata]|uniref:Uncharacterized protein n=1 Tax=Cotesia glomerata TaxID=32391 RepID=A0AAV7J980_COTGL|nr:hypothetical protein KQX54_021084 [Cotesia glomerata]
MLKMKGLNELKEKQSFDFLYMRGDETKAHTTLQHDIALHRKKPTTSSKSRKMTRVMDGCRQLKGQRKEENRKKKRRKRTYFLFAMEVACRHSTKIKRLKARKRFLVNYSPVTPTNVGGIPTKG